MLHTCHTRHTRQITWSQCAIRVIRATNDQERRLQIAYSSGLRCQMVEPSRNISAMVLGAMPQRFATWLADSRTDALAKVQRFSADLVVGDLERILPHVMELRRSDTRRWALVLELPGPSGYFVQATLGFEWPAPPSSPNWHLFNPLLSSGFAIQIALGVQVCPEGSEVGARALRSKRHLLALAHVVDTNRALHTNPSTSVSRWRRRRRAHHSSRRSGPRAGNCTCRRRRRV